MALKDDDCAELPTVVLGFVDAVNTSDLATIVGCFAPRAIVNDDLVEYQGIDAIALWAREHVVGQKLSIEVLRVLRGGAHAAALAKVDGTFDKRGLPDPLELTFYFCAEGNRLVQLLILRNEPALALTEGR